MNLSLIIRSDKKLREKQWKMIVSVSLLILVGHEEDSPTRDLVSESLAT